MTGKTQINVVLPVCHARKHPQIVLALFLK
jgi:hypothetical protein